MSFLVDTNVLSELLKPKPAPDVVLWWRKNEGALYVSTITIGEIRRGIERLPAGRRKTQLRAWLVELCDTMKGRILSFNTSTAHIWGQLKAKWDAGGVAVPSLDSQIAAIAQRYQLVLVTRNTADFARTGVKLLNPFLARSKNR